MPTLQQLTDANARGISADRVVTLSNEYDPPKLNDGLRNTQQINSWIQNDLTQPLDIASMAPELVRR